MVSCHVSDQLWLVVCKNSARLTISLNNSVVHMLLQLFVSPSVW